MSTFVPMYAIPFNSAYVSQMVGRIMSGRGARGQVLEHLVAYILRTVPGLRVALRIPGKGGEFDILVANAAPTGKPLRWLSD